MFLGEMQVSDLAICSFVYEVICLYQTISVF